MLMFLFCAQDIGAENNDATEIFRNLRCLTCNGQSIEESNSDFSRKLRAEIDSNLRLGYTKEDIYKKIKKEYGNEIFFTSPDNKNPLIVATLFTFIFCIVFLIYKKQR